MDEKRFNEIWTNAYCCGFEDAKDELIPNIAHPLSILFEDAYIAGYEDGMESIR